MERTIGRFFAVAVVALGLAACRDEQAGPKRRGAPVARASSSSQVRTLDAAPADLTFTSGATWGGGAVVYLGSKVSSSRVRPGEPVTITHYFKATRAPPQGFAFFVHGVDPANGQMLFNADHEIQEGNAPLSTWPVGKVIEDTSSLRAPRSSSGQVQLLLGFWADDQRLPVDDPRAHDGANRMHGPTLEVQDATPLPEYHVKKTAKPPVIDGDLRDPAWASAAVVDLVGSFDGRKPERRTQARLLYDEHHLYVAFDCEDPDVWGTLLKRDEPIYTQEAVEVFLDANGDGRTYNELEVSPNNTIFDAYFPARRQGMDLSWDSGMTTAVKVKGTLNVDSDRDEGWTVELKIPFDRLAEVPRLPPRTGDRWRFNLYRLEHVTRDQQIEGQAFSPLYIGDFHHLPRFGWLVFEGG